MSGAVDGDLSGALGTAYARQYRWWHDDSEAHFEQEVAAAESWLSRYWPGDRSVPLLDIGCGTGFVVAGFLRAGFTAAEGIDADRDQVRKAEARHLPVTQVALPAARDWLDAHRERYGFITAVDVLEHIPREHQLEFLATVHDLLRPGGMFVCRVPNGYSSMASILRYDDWTHYMSFTQQSLDYVLYNSGFQDIRIEGTPPLPLSVRLTKPAQWLLAYFRLMRRLEIAAEFGWHRARQKPLTPNIVGIATKATERRAATA